MEINSITCTLNTLLKQEYTTETSLLYWKKGCEQNEFDNKTHLFSNTHDLNNIDGEFEIGTTAELQPIGTNLIEFLNFDFNNFKSFFIYFTKYFGKYYTLFNYDDLHTLESSLIHKEYDKLIDISKCVYKKEKIM